MVCALHVAAVRVPFTQVEDLDDVTLVQLINQRAAEEDAMAAHLRTLAGGGAGGGGGAQHDLSSGMSHLAALLSHGESNIFGCA